MSGDGVEDSVYVNYFGVDGEAAMLACDMYGLLPENLLYQPKSYFIQTGDETEQIVLVRYTMCERSRQGTFRALLGAKTKLLMEGKVKALWKERCATLPDAPRCPRFSEAQLREAAGTLDTDSESDDERRLDERGMLKPPPPPKPQQPPPPQQQQQHETSSAPPASPFAAADAGETSLGIDGHSEVGSAGAAATTSAEASPGALRTPVSGDTPPPLRTPSSQHKEGSDGARSDGDTAVSGTIDDWRRIHALEKLVIPRPRKKTTKAPRIPQAYFPRTHDTLAKEEQELTETQRSLAQYSSKTSRRLHAKLRARHSVESAAERSASFPPLTSSAQTGNAAPGAGSVARGTTATASGAPTTAVAPAVALLNPLQMAEERNRREVAAMSRVAQQQVRQFGLSYDQGRAFDEEMEMVPTLGTLEHMLKYQKSIGMTPEFDDRLQTFLECEDAREAMRQEIRDAEWERARAVEARDLHAHEVLQRERERLKGVAAEANRTQRLITDGKQAAAQRHQAAHLNKVLRRTALRRAKADMYIEAKRAAASMSRYNHDQQEMYRRQLREDLRERQFRNDFADDYLDEDVGDYAESLPR